MSDAGFGAASDVRDIFVHDSCVNHSIAAAALSLARNKRSTVLTILCIAMGVAASATALSLAWTVTLRPLPFPNGDRMMRVWLTSAENPRLDMSIPDLHDIEASIPASDVEWDGFGEQD